MIIGMGTPRNDWFPIVNIGCGKPEMTYPRVITREMPFNIIIVPKVARIGEMSTTAIKYPFRNPTITPTARPAIIASKTTQILPESGLSGGKALVKIKAMMIPEIFALAIMDRLMPAVNMVIIIARVNIPSSGNWKAIDRMLRILIKLTPFITIISIVTTSKAMIKIER